MQILKPTSWKNVIVCWPPACRPQAGWNQKVDYVEFQLPHNQSIRGMSTSWSRTLKLSPSPVLMRFMRFIYIGFVLTRCMHACMQSCFSHVWLFATLWNIACQTSLSMGFSRQEYWSGLPWPPPGDLPDPGIEPASFMSPTLAGGFLPYQKKKKIQRFNDIMIKGVNDICMIRGKLLLYSQHFWCHICGFLSPYQPVFQLFRHQLKVQ